MILATADACRSVLRPVAAAMFDGEEAEGLLAAAAGADAEPLPRAGSALSSFATLKAQADRRRTAASRAANLDRARRAVAPFVERLDGLPDSLDIDSVGSCVVVTAATRRSAPGWVSQLAEGGDAGVVHESVRSALADLRGAVMRLELGASRLA